MINDLTTILWLSACFLGLFALSEIIHRITPTKVENTRKLVHFGTGILTLLFPVVLTSTWSVLLLCASFAVILLFSLKYKFLPSINAIDRESHGSILYPVAVFSCFVLYRYHENDLIFFYAPILILTISDPLAALFGKRWPLGKFSVGKDKKTLMGCTAFFCSALLVLVVTYSFFNPGISFDRVYQFVIIAGVTTLVEAISGKGIDNLTIPLSVVGLLSFFASI